ncbi:hypothetical protein XELAEV_18035626mg [Xenopus laevis]|uniref:Uncharacterized protein n=1 Tax=Xenopus laevis TaxID=8355 RepID=A0A974CGM6_XENLA|nr:hypothetical protein XELAEV_18035626mg [Xenopus laevis]
MFEAVNRRQFQGGRRGDPYTEHLPVWLWDNAECDCDTIQIYQYCITVPLINYPMIIPYIIYAFPHPFSSLKQLVVPGMSLTNPMHVLPYVSREDFSISAVLIGLLKYWPFFHLHCCF